jgi:hypothetical protein
MRKFILVSAVLVFLFGTAAMATEPWETYNELSNPCFIDAGDGWDYNSVVQFNGNHTEQGGDTVFGRTNIAYDPGPEGSPSGVLRQIVDDSLSPGWNPALNQKFFRLTAWVYTTGQAYVSLGVDWWNDPSIPRPLPGTPADGDMWTAPIYSPDHWVQVSWEGFLPVQPRWVSVEVAFYGCTLSNSEAAVDDMQFSARCVPEPSSILGFATGAMALIGFSIRRRIS